ncbi:palmitoyltransferase for Vac8p [Mortierella hygrophila]|uniref:Palmitoyltransferase n=1 Tax=Mortierella hygrophila TaxID=979708 RepID=A0A9P6K190_9FUNG|nr:palmitoyltransferase for Vac8p [Mortierella hygrophila]
MSGLHPPLQGNGLNNEPYRTVAPTTTTTTAPVTPAIQKATPSTTTTTTASSGAVALEIGGYKVHPSALAPNTTITGSSSSAFTTMTTGQLAAALAANDSLRNNNHNNNNNTNNNDRSGRRNSSDSSFISDFVVRLLPIALGSLVGYIVYVYNVRLCIDYILHFLNQPVQAGIYLGVFNVFALMFFVSYARTIFNNPGTPLKPPKRNPPPPIPPTTTPYRAQPAGKGDASNSSRNNNGHSAHQPVSDNTPLLPSTQSGDQPTLFSRYQAMKQSTLLNITAGQGQGQSQDIEAAHEAPAATLSISKKDGSPRWCELCQIVKPDRCHHCKECDQCVLRMDHHCPWVNSCIGYNNLKFFYLFLLYASLLAIWVISTTIPIFVTAYSRCEQNSLFAWMQPDELQHPSDCVFDVQWAVITVLSFFLTAFIIPLTAAHTIYILNNRTTIESLQDARSTYIRVQYRNVNSTSMYAPGVSPPRFNIVLVQPGESMWDRGSWNANWKGIMGPSWWLWFLPYANTPGDGIHEVYNERVYERLVAAPQTGYGQPSVRPLGSRGYGSGATDAVSSQSTLIPGSTYSTLPPATLSLAVPLGSGGWSKPRMSEESEESESSIGSLGRSLPTPHTSPRMEPRD